MAEETRMTEYVRKRHNLFSKKERRKLRSKHWPDMKPHIFDKLAEYIPGVLHGFINKS